MAKMRSTITYSSKLDKIMTDLSVREDIPKSEIIRRALVLYGYLYNESNNNGNRVVVTNSTGETAKEIIFP